MVNFILLIVAFNNKSSLIFIDGFIGILMGNHSASDGGPQHKRFHQSGYKDPNWLNFITIEEMNWFGVVLYYVGYIEDIIVITIFDPFSNYDVLSFNFIIWVLIMIS